MQSKTEEENKMFFRKRKEMREDIDLLLEVVVGFIGKVDRIEARLTALEPKKRKTKTTKVKGEK